MTTDQTVYLSQEKERRSKRTFRNVVSIAASVLALTSVVLNAQLRCIKCCICDVDKRPPSSNTI